ncbi:MAG: hypothetical protein Q4A11_01415 [Brachymonas sp.]|nr:hypothetical protein [Brachymonas sp.]
MLARLFIIGFLLCLPIAIALFSQQITRTVAPPKLPTAEQQVKLLGTARNGRSKIEAPNNEVSEGYTLRTIEHWGEGGEPVDEGKGLDTQADKLPDSEASAASVAPAPAKSARVKSNKR